MKTLFTRVILAVAISDALGQGLINFRSDNLTAPPSRLIHNGCGEPLVGTQFIAQLFHASDATNLDALPAVTETIVTRLRHAATTLPGTWSGGTRTLRQTLNGTQAQLIVRVWDETVGNSYAAAVAAGSGYGQSQVFAYTPPDSFNSRSC